MNIDTFEEIEYLLKEKDFSELNSYEKDLVLSELQKERYDALRQLVNTGKNISPIEPGRRIKHKLDIKFKKHQSQFNITHKIKQLVYYKVPFYRAAIAGIMVFSLFYLIAGEYNMQNNSFGITDTVYIQTNNAVAAGKSDSSNRRVEIAGKHIEDSSSARSALSADTGSPDFMDKITNIFFGHKRRVFLKDDTLLLINSPVSN